jgi:hypothetical protein
MFAATRAPTGDKRFSVIKCRDLLGLRQCTGARVTSAAHVTKTTPRFPHRAPPTPYPRLQAGTNIAAARGLSGVRIAGVCEDAVSLRELEVKMDEEAEYECKDA